MIATAAAGTFRAADSPQQTDDVSLQWVPRLPSDGARTVQRGAHSAIPIGRLAPSGIRPTDPVRPLEARLQSAGSGAGLAPARRLARFLAVVPAQLNVVTLGTRDLARQRDFYRGLGWPIAFEAQDFVAFQLRGAVLTLFPLEKLAADGNAEAAAPERGMRGFTLAFTVDRPEQVDEIIAEVEAAGGRVTKPPTDPAEFEGRHAYFADPEDNYWEVACP